MASFIENWRNALTRAFDSGRPTVRHFSDFTEEEKQRYRSMSPNGGRPVGPDEDTQSTGSAPGLYWPLIEGAETILGGTNINDARVIKRMPMGGGSSNYYDGGNTDDVTINDVVTGMVIRGMYGVGEDRKRRLYEDGFDYDRVMKRVNDAYRAGKQDYYGKLTDKYGIRFDTSSGSRYPGGQQYFIPDDYIGRQY